jgi:Replication-relaxation
MAKRIRDHMPTGSQGRLLADVNLLDLTTADQLRRFGGYSDSSLHWLQSQLKLLTEAGYLERQPYTYRPEQERGSRGGSSPLVYTIARAGWTWLRQMNIPTLERFHATERRARSQVRMREQLLINEVLLLARDLAATQPCVQVERILPLWQLKRSPWRVQRPGGRRAPLIPDSWIGLRTLPPARVERAGFAIELDTGATTDAAYIFHKLEGYLLLDQTSYEAACGMPYLQVLVIAVPGERRRRQLMRWCEAVLTRTGRQDEFDLFLFGALDPQRVRADQFFLEEVWQYPLTHQAVSLLDLTAPDAVLPAAAL